MRITEERTEWGEKPYYSLDYYLKQRFGGKIYKVALDAGFTCPNRDGKIGFGGCTFCAGGSGHFAGDRKKSITEQISEGIEGLTKFRAAGYIAYYQAFTNTYAPTAVLRERYDPAFDDPRICAVSIATRPDCLPAETLDLLSEYKAKKPVWVELGLQTIKPESAARVKRGYQLPCFENAVKELRKRGLEVIVHVILGLPGESKEDMLNTVRYLNRMDIQGIKLQLLHVIRGTALAEEYERGLFSLLTKEKYIDLVCGCIGVLSPDIVVHRLTGDGPSQELIGPLWSTRKMEVLNGIHHKLKTDGIYQGCFRREKHDVGTAYII